jgi:uncharacterized membrane protein
MKPLFAVPAVTALVYRAWSRKSLTPAGLVAATLTAIVHTAHPWSAPFLLLAVFYIGGTSATKVEKYLFLAAVENSSNAGIYGRSNTMLRPN